MMIAIYRSGFLPRNYLLIPKVINNNLHNKFQISKKFKSTSSETNQKSELENVPLKKSKRNSKQEHEVSSGQNRKSLEPIKLKDYDPKNFNPDTQPNETSAIHTSKGWFYIPKQFHITDKEPQLFLENIFKLRKFSSNKEIQDYIINEMCTTYQPETQPTKLKRKQLKLNEEMRKRKNLFKEQMLEINLEEFNAKLKKSQEPKPTKEVKPTKKGPKLREPKESTKLRFKITNNKVEIKGNLNLKHTWLYYQSKQLTQIPRLTKLEISNNWKKLPQNIKNQYHKDYRKLLLSGKDYYSGEIVDLSSRLSQLVEDDGFRCRKTRNELSFENRIKRSEKSRHSDDKNTENKRATVD
ncbi:hypothetical protein KGF54_000573 [Candida jiufengensis]|uniref:uncharacterized protein n=1 Tax=Candida jiufengensis TaxID=497108 RepID=UPI00222459C1|nr:uncharacterized protein KGF54_000573 [Candida jiufengensis]KAI5956954.1 hypothetical protein KGF54_000573 [Candida jiufengensis]